MKFPTLLTSISRASFLGLLMCATSGADVFILKDGTRLEGSILSQTADSYLLEIQVTRSIKDERRIPKDQIASIERRNKEADAFEELSTLAEIPDLLPARDYQARIDRLNAFIQSFPDSGFQQQIRDVLALHESELKVIEAGGLKMDGKLISAEERLENAYEIDARTQASEISRLGGAGSFLAALRMFQSMETDFTGSVAWHTILPRVRQICAAHRSNVARLLEEYDLKIARQQEGLNLMQPDERQRVERDIELRDSNLRMRYERERTNRITWITPNEFFLPSLQDTLRIADQEIARIDAAIAQPLPSPTPCEAWRNAITAIRGGEPAEITEAFNVAKNTRMSGTYIEKLQEILARQQPTDGPE